MSQLCPKTYDESDRFLVLRIPWTEGPHWFEAMTSDPSFSKTYLCYLFIFVRTRRCRLCQSQEQLEPVCVQCKYEISAQYWVVESLVSRRNVCISKAIKIKWCASILFKLNFYYAYDIWLLFYITISLPKKFTHFIPSRCLVENNWIITISLHGGLKKQEFDESAD